LFAEFVGIGVQELPPVGGWEGDAEQGVWCVAFSVAGAELAAVPFADGIARWEACQAVISATLTFLNQHGLCQGVVTAYQQVTANLATGPASQQLVTNMTTLLRDYESQLQPGERVPISTEILESSFALYKQLEQQHAKSGFTNLLLTFPTLLQETTAEEVIACFAVVKVADIKAWADKTNAKQRGVDWQFKITDARTKLKRLYPVIKTG
jgi:hypothetical protein